MNIFIPPIKAVWCTPKTQATDREETTIMLTIGFTGDVDSLVQSVNNYAQIIRPNYELSNGYIHVINEVLKPVIYNSYEWLLQYPEYSIFASALEITGLKDSLETNTNGSANKLPVISLLVESNQVFERNGIQSIDDLIEEYSPNKQDYKNYSNELYQFVAYHFLEGRRFLNDFEGINTNYNTYGSFPLSINGTGIDIQINKGVDIFDSVIVGMDTTIIDFVRINYDQSNVLTKNGAIHFLRNILELYRPTPKFRRFEFYEEPLISAAEKQPNTYIFNRNEDNFEVISWEGVGIDEILYVKSPANIAEIWNNDYIEIEGDFSIAYSIPRILPGKYMLQLKVNSNDNDNAFIQVYLDGQVIGSNIDLTKNPGAGDFYTYDIGQVDFTNYEKHIIKIQTVIPGLFSWDGVNFQPTN